jgi:hypothetical protein
LLFDLQSKAKSVLYVLFFAPSHIKRGAVFFFTPTITKGGVQARDTKERLFLVYLFFVFAPSHIKRGAAVSV